MKPSVPAWMTTLAIMCGCAQFACVAEPMDEDEPTYVLMSSPPERHAPWPDPPPPAKTSCELSFPGWQAPALEVHIAGLHVNASSSMLPRGEVERLTIEARWKPELGVDSKGAGPFEVTVDSGLTVLSQTELSDGLAELRVRLDTPGVHTISVKAAGNRVGSTQVFVYEPQLPIWRILADDVALGKVMATPSERLWIPVTLELEGGAHEGQLRLHGGSSRFFSKKSFRINLKEDSAVGAKVILRAEYADKTMLRNFLSFEMLRQGTWLPACQARFVNLRVNERAYGVMLHTERIDRAYLKRRGLSPDGSLYEADPPFEKSVPGGNLTPVEDPLDYRIIYQRHAGEQAYEDLIELIEAALQASQQEARAHLNKVVKLDDVLVYIAFQGLIQNQDFVKKNYYLFRDPEQVDSRWSVIPWDLDLSWGHLWTEDNDVLDENIFIDGDLDVGRNKGHSFFNQLIERALEQPAAQRRRADFVAHMVDEVFTEAWVADTLQAVFCPAQAEWMGDPRKRADNTELPQRIAEISDYVTARRAFVNAWLAEQGDPSQP